ncbi:MAG: BrnT family toxin [Acidobacteria bacterium]|nr:BrnT family toxin [Acidobacteriota bacterium]
MDTRYTLNEINFVWDAKKATANIKNHRGISFELACEVFFDPLLLVQDGGIAEGEQREAVIGMTAGWRLLYVVYVLRADDVRIVSARLATKPERRLYENG